MCKVLLFDLETKGHHLDYLRHLIIYSREYKLPCCLYLVVAPEFITKAKTYFNDFVTVADDKVHFVPIPQNELAWLKSSTSMVDASLKSWKIAKKYVEKFSTDQCIFMWFDHILQFPMALHRIFPCAISGICFRPMFHYAKWRNQPLTFKERLKAWRQLTLYHLAVRHPQLQTIFCLDPYVPETINKLSKQNKAIYLPDPVELPSTPIKVETLANIREALGINPNRKIYLFFGAIAARKGIFQLLTAVENLDFNVSSKITLLLVGEIVHLQERKQIIQAIDHLRANSPVQIIFQNEYVSDNELRNYLSISHAILALYQKHVGMSGILLHAAAAGKPVISSNYGLMGKMIEIHELGLAINTEDPKAIAKAIAETLNLPASELCNSQKMKIWAQQNSPKRFADTIFSQILKHHA